VYIQKKNKIKKIKEGEYNLNPPMCVIVPYICTDYILVILKRVHKLNITND